MRNDLANYLELICPKCGSRDFRVSLVVEFRPDAAECLVLDDAPYWEDETSCRCVDCEHLGDVYDFIPYEEEIDG